MAKKTKTAPAPREPTPEPVLSDDSDYSSSDDEIEDEDGAELTPAMDAAILQTLAKIRNKDGQVYSGESVIGTALEAAQKQAAKRGLGERTAPQKEDKPFLLKDMHRANLLAGVQPTSDDEEEEPLTNFEAERRARKDALSAFNALADDDSDEEEDFLVKREQDAAEVADEDAAYRSFLLEMGGGEVEVRKALGMADAPVTDYREDVVSDAEEAAPKKEKKEKKKKATSEEKAAKEDARRAKRVQADEDFLMDYILNRGWIDKEKKDVPTYEDIVGRVKSDNEDSGSEDDSDDEGAAEHPWGKLDDEDEFDDKADEFEHEYNFRFEEPGAGYITTHPRQINSLVRREDDTRKNKRDERAERKAAEKAAKEEETRRLKGQKRREMEGMLDSLKEELGDYVNWEEVEKIMDGDFDEDEWERVVTAMLQAKADHEEGITMDDEEKPSWDDDDMGNYDEAEDDGWVEPTRWEEQDEAFEGEDDDEGPINMDADFIGLEDEGKKKKSKKDKKGRKAEKRAAEAAAETAAMSFEERTEKLKAAATELNALQGEDTIGDLRTRFKYTKGAPVHFGLSAAEILMATDAELNDIVSVKHLAPYRRGGLGIAGRGLGKRVRDLKTKVSQRKWGDEMPVEGKKGPPKKKPAGPGGANALPLGDGKKAKRLGKNERMKQQKTEGEGEGAPEQAAPAPAPPASGKRKRENEPAPAASAAAAAPAADSEGKKKRRKKKKAGAEA